MSESWVKLFLSIFQVLQVHHTTYHNQLKLYINSLQTKEEVNQVYYGMELSGEYLDTYNEIMQNANLIVSVFTAN